MAGRGLQDIPIRPPQEWSASWYLKHIREVLALVDIRNAIEGPGITITGNSSEPATLSASSDISGLLNVPFVTLSLSSQLTAERVITAGQGIALTDAGAGSSLTISVDDIPYNLFGDMPALSVFGNQLPTAATPSFIGGTAAGDVLWIRDVDGAGTLNVQFSNDPVWTGNHTWIDNAEVQLGVGGDLRLFHDGANSTIQNDTGQFNIHSDAAMAVTAVGNFSLAAGGTGQVASGGTLSLLSGASHVAIQGDTDVRITGGVPLRLISDNQELQIGAGDDLRLFHDGADSFIRNDTGALRFLYGASEAIQISSTGGLGAAGANFGTAGQVLTSTGNAPPAWDDPSGADASLTYITEADETADLPNSLQLVAGTNITLDTTTPNQIEISASGGGTPTFSGALVTRDAVQSISNETTTLISWNTETFDTDAYHDNSTNPSRFTAPATGYYAVGCNIDWASGGSAGNRIAWLIKNGATTGIFGNTTVVSNNQVRYNLNTIVQLTAGDYVEVNVYQSSGGSLNLSHSDNALAFWIQRIG
jgi:hypothetical protein